VKSEFWVTVPRMARGHGRHFGLRYLRATVHGGPTARSRAYRTPDANDFAQVMRHAVTLTQTPFGLAEIVRGGAEAWRKCICSARNLFAAVLPPR
jgi:hypothetical protein